MSESRIRDEDAEVMIQALAGYSLPEQIGCLFSLLFSHVSQACGNDMAKADALMHQLFQAFPTQWKIARAALAMEMMTPTGLPN